MNLYESINNAFDLGEMNECLLLENSANYPDEYSKLMHDKFIKWVKLKNKENLNDDEVEDLYALQQNLADANWFAHERDLKKKKAAGKDAPWVIAVKDTPEQRKREEAWAPVLAIYETIFDKLQNGRQLWNVNRSAENLIRTQYFFNGNDREINEFLKGIVKYSEKKKHEYRVPRQLDKPSEETIYNMNMANTIMMVAFAGAEIDPEFTKRLEFNIKGIKNASKATYFNIMVPAKHNEEFDEESIKKEFGEFMDKLVEKFKDMLPSKSYELITKHPEWVGGPSGDERSNNYYYYELMRNPPRLSADSVFKSSVVMTTFPMLKFV